MRGCRALTKADLKLNSATPKMHVDPETYIVTADGEELRCEPASVLPLAQRYFLILIGDLNRRPGDTSLFFEKNSP